MMTDKQRQNGFTLTELMLAMSFVTFLLLFVVTATVQSLRIYNKGIAIRHINQAGRQLNDELSRSLRYSSSFSFKSLNTDPNSIQRLCTGGVTYAWNIEDINGLNEVNKYSGSNASNPVIRFVRVDDKSGLLCSSPTTPINRDAARELIDSGLAAVDIEVEASSDSRIVQIVSILATEGNNLPVVDPSSASGYMCPQNADGAYCAFGEFQIAVYIRN